MRQATVCAIFLLLINIICIAKVAHAQLYISEIMHHPHELDLPFPDFSDREDAEYIELWNSSNSAMDISNFLIDGINYIFPAGTVIAAGAHVVLAKDDIEFQEVYGFSPFDVYCGSLSNNGESIQLVDDNGRQLHKVNYKQKGNWPELADGLGHSLELICHNCDASSFENWNVSVHPNGHTAGNSNSQFLQGDRPAIDSVNLSIEKPNPNQSVIVKAFGRQFQSAQLLYVINNGSFQSITGTINGDCISFTIPGQAAHTVVNYKITVTNQYGSYSWPRADGIHLVDSYVVSDPNQAPSQYPILNWYYDAAEPDPSDYNESVFEYNGDTYNNTYVWWRRNKHWKVEMSKNANFTMDNLGTFAMDEFQLNRPDHAFNWWVNGSMARTAVFTQIIGEAGEPALDAFTVRLDENGQRGKIWTLLSWPDGNWRKHVGLEEEGSMYVKFASVTSPDIFNPEVRFPKGADPAPVWDLIAQRDIIGPQLMDIYDIPGMVNFAALSTLICHWDAPTKNFYLHRKSNGRWDGDIWDVDAGPRTGIEAIDADWCKCAELPRLDDYTNPYSGVSYTNPSDAGGSVFVKPLLENMPRVNEMYERRLRTLVDKYYAPGELINRVYQVADPTDPDVISTASSYDVQDAVYQDNFAVTQQRIFVDYPAWQTVRYNAKPGFPSSASGNHNIVFNEIQYAPVGGDSEEFVELYNNDAESVDMTGWKIKGIDVTFPAGTVILPNDYLVVAKWSPTFISKYGSGKYVAADFTDGQLKNGGEALRLLNATGQVIDSINYELTGWNQAHGGPSLERINPTAPTNDPANWAPSSAAFGTPDAVNNPAIGSSLPPTPLNYNLVINEIMYENRDFNDLKGSNLEFIELYNCGNQSVDLSEFYFNKSIEYRFPVGSSIAPNSYLVLSRNKSAFKLLYGFDSFDQYDGNLDNAGEHIVLYNENGYVVDSLSYLDDSPWPQGAEGSGFSIALTDCTSDNAAFANWSIQSVLSTPGALNVFTNLEEHMYSGIVVNEIHYNPFDSIDTATSDTISGKNFEFIELVNVSNLPIDMRGAFFSQGIDYIFPDTTSSIIQPSQYIVLAEDKSSFLDRYGFQPFDKYDGKLNNDGEKLWLNSASGTLLDVVDFDDTFPWDNTADGGLQDNSLALINANVNNNTRLNWKVQCAALYTPGMQNDFACFPGLNYTGLVINEIHYNPIQGNLYEYIEIVNHSNQIIDLESVAFSEGIFYTFEQRFLPGVQTYPNNYIVLAKDSATYHNTYGHAPDGIYIGVLSNSGEQLVLRGLFGNIIDAVAYDDVNPWNPIADQGNKSLALIDGSLDNSLAGSWCVQDVNNSPRLINSFADSDNDSVIDCLDDCANFNNNLIGSACSDGDPCTSGETYGTACNCAGGVFQDTDDDGVCDVEDVCPGFDDTIDNNNNNIPDGCEGDCPTVISELSNSTISHDTSAIVSILTNGKVTAGNEIEYHAGNSIELMHGFEVETGALFHAYIVACQ